MFLRKGTVIVQKEFHTIFNTGNDFRGLQTGDDDIPTLLGFKGSSPPPKSMHLFRDQVMYKSCTYLKKTHSPFEKTVGNKQKTVLGTLVWSNYSDLSRGHPKWWFSKGIPPKMALNKDQGFIINCPDWCWSRGSSCSGTIVGQRRSIPPCTSHGRRVHRYSGEWCLDGAVG